MSRDGGIFPPGFEISRGLFRAAGAQPLRQGLKRPALRLLRSESADIQPTTEQRCCAPSDNGEVFVDKGERDELDPVVR